LQDEDMSENSDDRMMALEAAAFRRLIGHLALRQDASNIALMGLAGFCRNCLADWLEEASIATGQPLTREEARTHVYGEPYADFKARQPAATAEELARMEASVALNAKLRGADCDADDRLDRQLDQSFPASDTPKILRPR
jgi:hypothetical protein